MISFSKMGKKQKVDDDDAVYGNLDSSDDEDAKAKAGGKRKGSGPKSKGIKWSAVFFLALFVIPGFLGVVMYVYDYMFPEVLLTQRVALFLVND
jgi:hypothetical protein